MTPSGIPDTLFRPDRHLQAAYREDCQCVRADFCSALDVVHSSDIRQLLDARTRGSDILSNATDFTNATEEEGGETQNSVRRARLLDLSAERVEENATVVPAEEKANTTEEITVVGDEEYTTETTELEGESAKNDTAADGVATKEGVAAVSRRRREAEEEKVAVSNDRQGVS